MNRRQINDRILILCSGISEYLYAKALVRELPKDQQRSVSVDQFYDTGLRALLSEATRRVHQAKTDRNAFTAVWLFFCKNNTADDATAFEAMEQGGLFLAYTPICFEYWVAIHFEDCEHYRSCEEALQQVRRFLPEYKKCKAGVFDELHAMMPQAIGRAARLQIEGENELQHLKSPFFTVPQLIAYIEQLKTNNKM